MVEFKFKGSDRKVRAFCMTKGNFYFIKTEYFKKFNDLNLMKNKENNEKDNHNRPCYYSFQDNKTKLFWMIPFSSQVDKFKKIYSAKIAKYKKCDTIVFGKVLGFEKAFLIQNMCPITEQYILNEYHDTNNNPVRIDSNLEKELTKKAKRILLLQRKGLKLVFPDIISIENQLLKEIN